MRNLVEQRLIRQLEKKYPPAESPELEKLRNENTYLRKINRVMGKLLQEKQRSGNSGKPSVKKHKTPNKNK